MLLLGTAGVFTGAFASLSMKAPYHAKFVVTGDVQNVFDVDSFSGFRTYTAVRDGKSYKSLLLSDLIDLSKPYSDENMIVLEGDDGLIAEVDAKSMDGMYITYTAENAWELINYYHPPSSNIKRLAAVRVIARNEQKDQMQTIAGAVNIIAQNKNIASITPGQFFMNVTNAAPVFEGESVKTSGKGNYSVAVYTERRFEDVAAFAPEAVDLLIMGDDGQYSYDASPGRIELQNIYANSLSYLFSDGRTRMNKVRGILVDPPTASIMDAYQESVNYINNGSRVLVFLVDGLGYNQYTYAEKNGFVPFLGTKTVKQATTVYQPVTNSGLAAMLTGQPPYKNGVYDRDFKDLKVNDIFSIVSAAGKTSAYIEGNIKILNTSIEPTLNADLNGDGSTDPEVFGSAQISVASDADFIFVHFHGVDDMGHKYGDINDEVMAKIKEIDGYIQRLTRNFSGRVIVTADHGMHKTADGGDHGVFRFEDMIVPYISFGVSF